MPSERVPDPLRQKFFLHKCDYELEYSAHICLGKDRDCGVKFLRDCTGEFLNLVALYRANLLVVCRIQEDGVQLCFLFPEELSIKEIEYIRCQDGMFGFVVALNSKKISVHPHCVALLHCCNYGLQLVRKLKIDQEIACLKVVADADSMIQLKSLLHSKMASWPHIVVVGTRYAHCFLFHFEQLEPQQGTDVHVPLFGKLTDGLASFHDGDTFIYSSVDSCTGKPQTKRLSRESVYVSCISFMEKSRTVILGFSFGGIMSISLTSCPTIEPLIYPCSAPVQFITPLEPDDDPRAHLWFFVAYAATKAKPVQLCLYEVMFPEEETIPISERKWSKPMFGIKLVIPFHNSSRWVSLQTLIRDRNKIRRADESTRDSFKLGSEKDKSLVFFTFIANDKNGSGLKGGVFDLNAYYYKRLVHAIIHDGTAAQQCAFMSIVQPITTNVENEDFLLSKDCIVDTRCITRFISTTNDAEQMFYPSAFEISSRFVFAIYVAGTKKCYHFRLPSLPNQLLSSICADLELHVADARNACTWLAALGFCKKETHKAKNQYKDLSSVLSVLISHQRTRAVLQFIKRCDCSESRHLIATWIWEEIDIASKKLHETIAPLFARFSAPLSPAGRMSFAHVNDVFVAGVQIFRELLRTCKREQDETEEYMTSLEAQRFATENLRSYSAVIRQLMHSKILPVAEDREIRLAMEESLRKRRLRITCELNVDKLVTRMRKRCPSEPFWYAEGPEWYPPALLNLLAPILVLNIPIKWNGQLLAFYLLDYASCKIECDFNSDVAVNLVDLIAKQMHGILCMNKDEIQNVYNMWCDDCGKCVAEELNERSSLCIDNLSAASEVEELMNIPRPLSVAEENKLKVLLDSLPFGNFRWQCYLAMNRRYNEIIELPIPPNAEQRKEVKEYLEILPAIKILRNDYVHLSIDRPQWPPKIKEAIEKFEYGKHVNAPSYGSGIPVLNRAKTPIPLPKLSSKLNAKNGWDGTATSMVQHIGTNSTSRTNESLEITSTKADVLSVNEDDLSLPVNIPINTLNNITDILRTPRARACAAAQAELQRKWIDRTPEGEFQRAVPRSILKSGKLDRGTSPSRTRLQFDLPSSGSSSIKPSESPLDTSKTFQKIIQPNFEESLEYNGDEICSPMETEENVEPTLEEFVPLITSDSESHSDHGSENEKRIDYNNLPFEIGSVLQKSSEVQDEDEHEQQGRTDYCETITEVEMQDEDCLYFVENTTEKLVERQEDDDISQESCAEISIKNSGQENLNDIMLEEQEVDSSVELQEDCCYVDVTTFVKCEAVVSAKLGRVTAPVSGNVMEGATLTLDTEMKPSDQSRNGVKDNQKEKTTETNAPQISAITENKKSTPDLLLGVSHVKLVDHSSNHPTKECSFAPPTKEMEHKITESLAGLFTSDKSSNLCSVTKTQLEVLPASVCQEHSSRADIESEMDVLLRTPCVEYSESLDPDVAVLSKQRSNRKSSRTSTPATPTRQSLRLREKGLGSSIIAMDSVEESMQSSNAKRTRKKSSSSDTDLCMPLSKRKSVRKRASVNETLSKKLDLCNDLPEESLDRDLSADITSMPSDRVLRSMSWKTPDVNKGPESNQQLDVIHETPVHRSRSRKTSTTDEEHASVVRRSPSRRTPSSVRKLSGGRPSTSKRSNSRSKTVKTLEGKFTMPQLLGGIDARLFFDMVSEKKILDVPSSRRRSLSESGIPDVKEYSGKVEVWNTIAGVEAESGSRESRSRTLPDADIDEVSRNKRQTRSRARRSTSANSTFRRELIEPSNEMP